MTPPLTENILAIISDVLLPKLTSGDLRIPATINCQRPQNDTPNRNN